MHHLTIFSKTLEKREVRGEREKVREKERERERERKETDTNMQRKIGFLAAVT